MEIDIRPKVSIIVPVYNVEKYIHRCINSILSQTFSEFECILVDDCSPDKSSVVCDEYVVEDKRIQVIHKKQNEGLPQARKTGLDSALGGYVLYVDSDDWIENNMVEKMYNKAIQDDLEVVCCNFYEGEGERESFKNNMSQYGFNDRNTIIKQLLRQEFQAMLWFKLVKKDIYKKCIFPYENMWEDMPVMLQILYYSNKIGYINDVLYHYTINPVSISGRKSSADNKIIGMYKNMCLIIDFLSNKYQDNIVAFEPELSDCVNLVKLEYMNNKKLRNVDKLFELYPSSNKFFFNKSLDINHLYKTALSNALNNKLFLFKVLDILIPCIHFPKVVIKKIYSLLPMSFRNRIYKYRRMVLQKGK